MPEIKNLEKAAKRIEKAIKNKEKIILFGDADLDGTTSLIILEEAIKNLGGSVFLCYFPDRENEGYGLNKKALNFLKKYSPALIILLDCGIGNFEEIEMAKKLSLEVIVIDHHDILNDKIPDASIVVDPKQKEDNYPFKFLAACGLSLKLAQIILGKKISQSVNQSFSELAALGTVADMMPQIQDNQTIIEKGLGSLYSTLRPGLRVFLKFFDHQNFSLKELTQKIVSILQITDSVDHLNECYLFLTSPDEDKAQKLFDTLIEKNLQRQEIIKNLAGELIEKVKEGSPFVFEGGTEFPLVLTGALASRICRTFKKPAFVFSQKEKLTRGSVRTPEGMNSVEILKQCESLLEVYGGHPPASGFTVKSENLEKLRNCLKEYFLKPKT